jgi:hypothetical protein
VLVGQERTGLINRSDYDWIELTKEVRMISKKIVKYFAKHPTENAMAHLMLGMGAGFMLTYPLAATHPVRWGAAFFAIGIVMHIRAMR